MAINIGNSLKAIRTTKNLTQLQLSKMTNFSPSYISDIENNRKVPTIDTLNTISECLKVPITLLLGETTCCRDMINDDSNISNLFSKCCECTLVKVNDKK